MSTFLAENRCVLWDKPIGAWPLLWPPLPVLTVIPVGEDYLLNPNIVTESIVWFRKTIVRMVPVCAALQMLAMEHVK